jgi:hypothetical protein
VGERWLGEAETERGHSHKTFPLSGTGGNTMGNIVLRNVHKAFGATTIIPDIDLDIADGEFVVFVGPSGCGKSTLLRLIAGLEDTTSGTIMIDGRDVTSEAPAKRKLAMVFQSYALYPHMTVAKNIAFPLSIGGPASSPAGSASASPSAAPSCATPRRSCSTSRCPTSMRRCAARCGWRFPSCTSSSRPPWSTSPTTRWKP